jgi:hypothetical protein
VVGRRVSFQNCGAEAPVRGGPPGPASSVLQTLDPSREQRDEASRADQGSAPLDICRVRVLGKLAALGRSLRCRLKPAPRPVFEVFGITG